MIKYDITNGENFIHSQIESSINILKDRFIKISESKIQNLIYD